MVGSRNRLLGFLVADPEMSGDAVHHDPLSRVGADSHRLAGKQMNHPHSSFYKQRAFGSDVWAMVNVYPEGTMSSGTTDKIKGATNEAAGKATGSTKLKREGDIQEAKGDAQKAMGRAKTALKK